MIIGFGYGIDAINYAPELFHAHMHKTLFFLADHAFTSLSRFRNAQMIHKDDRWRHPLEVHIRAMTGKQ